MVFGRIVFNNVREYTPAWMKTVSYSKVQKPILRKGVQRVSPFNADPKVKRMWRAFQKVTNNPGLWHVYVFLNAFAITFGIYYPWRYIYSANNRHRSIDTAIAKEKAYKKSQESEEQD